MHIRLTGAAMVLPFLLSACSMQSLQERAAPAMVKGRLVTSPGAIPEPSGQRALFLGGSIDMGNARDWQADMVEALQNEDVIILNPRRSDWNPDWKPVAEDPNFRAQVEWELAALERSDVIVMYFAPGSKSPISLLELGLYARSGKLIILCPEGFWRKGNVDITAQTYGITQVGSFEELIAAVKLKLGN